MIVEQASIRHRFPTIFRKSAKMTGRGKLTVIAVKRYPQSIQENAMN